MLHSKNVLINVKCTRITMQVRGIENSEHETKKKKKEKKGKKKGKKKTRNIEFAFAGRKFLVVNIPTAFKSTRITIEEEDSIRIFKRDGHHRDISRYKIWTTLLKFNPKFNCKKTD